MRRTHLTIWAALLLAVALATTLAAGCGGGDKSADAASPAPEGLTAQEIVDQSTAAMQKLNSASFTADFKLDLEGDASKMSDPTAQQLLAKPITLHAEGASSTDPQAADMDVTVSLMGQDLAVAVLSDGKKAWVQYEDTWYAVPADKTKALQSSDAGALPTDQLRDLGLDPQKWDVAWELAGTETLDGVDVYHVTASPDPTQILDDVMKALENPKLYKKLGDPEAAKQLKSMKAENAKQLKEAQEALESVAVELWIDSQSMYVRKGSVRVDLDTKGLEGAEGLDAMTIAIGFTMADFDEPVTVEPPAKAKDFDTLMNEIAGGMMGGAF